MRRSHAFFLFNCSNRFLEIRMASGLHRVSLLLHLESNIKKRLSCSHRVPSDPRIVLPWRTTVRLPNLDRYFTIIGRLQSGISFSQAQSEFAVLHAELEPAAKFDNPGTGILEPIARGAFYLHDQFARALSLLLWGLFAFLSPCAQNVAGLLLVRTFTRLRATNPPQIPESAPATSSPSPSFRAWLVSQGHLPRRWLRSCFNVSANFPAFVMLLRDE